MMFNSKFFIQQIVSIEIIFIVEELYRLGTILS